MKVSFNTTLCYSATTSVHVGCGLIRASGQLLLDSGIEAKAVIITHPEVNNLYGQVVENSLATHGITSIFLEMGAGDKHKQWNSLSRLIPLLQAEQLDKSCAIGSLGGGVAGDLAGFLASLYMRGTKLFHLPTTLIAQVDSSFGGRTALNFGQTKNLLGTNYQPDVVIADPDTLFSLPRHEFAMGMAEVIKTALLSGEDFLLSLEKLLLVNYSAGQSLLTLPRRDVATLVERCLRFKAKVVQEDVRDKDARQQLNLGHTFGHALEAAGHFVGYTHGEAVGLGLLAALRLSERRLGLSPAIEGRVRRLLKALQLPTTTQFIAEDLAPHLARDEKQQCGTMNFVGLSALGKHALLSNISLAEVKFALAAISV